MKHKILLLIASVSLSLQMKAQTNGSNSAYSRYGFGLLNNRVSAFSTAMAGAGISMRNHRELNFLNPASYSAIDSLTMLFNIGLSLQNGNFDQNGSKLNARNTSIDYISAGFQMARHLGFSLGLMPYSTIGYKVKQPSTLEEPLNPAGTIDGKTIYQGSGGLHEAYLGMGWEFMKGLSVGVNAGYLWGNLQNTVQKTFSETSIQSLQRKYASNVRTYKLDVGLQYEQRIGKKNSVLLGLSYGMGHDIKSNAYYYNESFGSAGTLGDTITLLNAYELPVSYGVGLGWNYKNSLRVGLDYTLQQWGNVKSPAVFVENNKTYLRATPGLYKDLQKISLGIEWQPNNSSLLWKDHVRYRCGVSYASPYAIVNGKEGPYTLCLGVGVGLPIVNFHSKRTLLNLGFQYERVQPKIAGMVTEQYLRFSIGVDFSERWFEKWRAR